MSTDKGYIRLYRDIREHWIWNDSENLRAWIDLIMMANHEDKQVYFSGNLIIVRKGSFITSVRKLASRWGWGKDRVLHFLRILEKEGMIDRKADSKKTLITLIKYEDYQGKKPKKQTVTGTLTRTQTGTQTGTLTSHNEYTKNTLKNTLKEKEDEPSPITDEMAKEWGWI